MDLLTYPAGGFIVILLASCFLFAELLVKAKGLLALTASGLFIYYFLHFLTDQASPWIFLLLIGGLLLIIIDGKLFTTGIIGVFGFILMVLGCALPTPTLLYGMLVGIAFVIGACGSLFFRKILPQRDYLDKLMLHDKLSSDKGYNSINSDYHELIGKEGKTMTPFHPVGTVKIDGKNYSAITDGIFLEKNAAVKVISVDGTRIFIDQVDGEN
ncbi:nodulation protein NfeD [Sporolactobacillus shoreicorticis]|uniref:NfeD family protein n=1 Tax=Sporolactobacillus shoreicorticis TaxID=1923877 RepID=A0ABW5S7F7_9BACL|nr:NfeD family protein [Sporolactobacillus shoreicorticis]MCO7126307.1 nodulation protein NfeD [Sporolactobacillus shoreicorticis]